MISWTDLARRMGAPRPGTSPSRRFFLGGSASLLALPWLESLAARNAHAATPPKRLIYYFVPNGKLMSGWTPKGVGNSWQLSPTLMPLAAVKSKLTCISGLDMAPAIGQGDHARGGAAFLTCAPLTPGLPIKLGVSCDQIAAQRFGTATRFASLQFGTGMDQVGTCDGHSCIYTSNISWATPSQPMAKISDPLVAFERLFKGMSPVASTKDEDRRRAYRKSVLDFAVADIKRLDGRLAVTDRSKLDQYLTGVRDLEKRIVADANGGGGASAACPASPTAPVVTTNDYFQHVKLFTDIMVLALQCDLTRVVSFMYSIVQTSRNYARVGADGGHHDLSHSTGADAERKLLIIDKYETTEFASLLTKLDAIDEGGTTLLDNTLAYYSNELSDGNAHSHKNLPTLLAGRAGGVKTDRHLMMPAGTPMANLFVSMLRAVDVPVDKFGDSNGSIPLTS